MEDKKKAIQLSLRDIQYSGADCFLKALSLALRKSSKEIWETIIDHKKLFEHPYKKITKNCLGDYNPEDFGYNFKYIHSLVKSALLQNGYKKVSACHRFKLEELDTMCVALTDGPLGQKTHYQTSEPTHLNYLVKKYRMNIRQIYIKANTNIA